MFYRRYSLLGYMNTILLTTNEPIIRPIFYHYSTLLQFYDINIEEFLLGHALVVAPVLDAGVTRVILRKLLNFHFHFYLF